MPVVSATCYELLGVPVEAPAPALDSAWRLRRLEAERRIGALAEEEVEALCARVDEAYRILADPVRARRYRQYRGQLASSDWGGDEDAVVTDPALRAWEPAPAGDLDLLADVVRAADQSPPLPDPREVPPWRRAEPPIFKASGPALAPAALGPEQDPGTSLKPPWLV